MPTIGRNPDKTRNELSAAESGAQARAQAQQTMIATRQQGIAQGQQLGQQIGAQAQQGEELKVQKGAQAEQVRSNKMREAQESDRQDIEMADKGLESQGASRADLLRQEMERGRLQQQMDKPVEVASPDRRTIAPTEARSQETAGKTATARMNAQANYYNAVTNLRKAKLEGNDEAFKNELKTLEQPINSAAKLFDLGKNDKLSPDQWENIKTLAKDNPDQALQAEIQSGTFGPRLGQFLQNRVGSSSLQFIAFSEGRLPDGDLIDMSSPLMVQFTQSCNQMASSLKQADESSGGLISRSLKIDSLAKRNQFVRRITAEAMLKELEGAAMKAQQPQMPIPSQGGQSSATPIGTPGRSGVPARAKPNPQLDDRNPVQQQLQQREQQGIEAQQRADAERKSDRAVGRYGPPGRHY